MERFSKASMRAIVEHLMNDRNSRYREVTGKAIDPNNGYAQCSVYSTSRPNSYSCSQAENAHRIYGEWSAMQAIMSEYLK